MKITVRRGKKGVTRIHPHPLASPSSPSHWQPQCTRHHHNASRQAAAEDDTQQALRQTASRASTQACRSGEQPSQPRIPCRPATHRRAPPPRHGDAAAAAVTGRAAAGRRGVGLLGVNASRRSGARSSAGPRGACAGGGGYGRPNRAEADAGIRYWAGGQIGRRSSKPPSMASSRGSSPTGGLLPWPPPATTAAHSGKARPSCSWARSGWMKKRRWNGRCVLCVVCG